jgi:ribonuclease D
MDTCAVKMYQRRARVLWGTSVSRPQTVYPGLLDSRVEINKKDWAQQVHPCPETVQNWFFSSPMYHKKNPYQLKGVVPVRILEELVKVREEIRVEREFAFLIKENSEDSFLGMSSILQIYVKDTAYVIDTLSLHRAIKTVLDCVFQDVNVLKICHSGALLLMLQRDFGIFCVGVVLTHEIYCHLKLRDSYVSYKEMVKALCKFELNVTAQYADWRKRPLHETLTKEAGDEVHILMKCWHQLKEQFGDCLMLFEFQKSRDACLKLYSPKRSKSPDDLFQVNMAKLSSSLKSVFNIESQRMLFAKIYEWREEQCKLIDKPRSDFLPKGKMGFITRAQPLTRNSLVSLFPDANAWKMTQVNSLIDCIRSAKHEEEMEVEDRPIEVVVSTRDSVPEEHHSSVLSSSDAIPEESFPQVSRSQKIKQLRKLQNIKRGLQGLPLLPLKRNRGVKDRERSKLRALKFTLSREGLW